MFLPKEATTKAGGLEELKKGVMGGRIIHQKRSGLSVFFFPRFEYARENVFKQELHAEKEKKGSEEVMEQVMDDQWGFEWGASAVVKTPSSLGTMDPSLMLSMASTSPAPLPLGSSASSLSSLGTSSGVAFPCMQDEEGPMSRRDKDNIKK